MLQERIQQILHQNLSARAKLLKERARKIWSVPPNSSGRPDESDCL
jgi:hypothetical protein